MAKRGEHVYHKAFGFADREAGRKMTVEAQMRCFSMTKVMTSAVALMLQEQGLISLEDSVSDFIPSFDKEWIICSEAETAADASAQVDYTSFLTGTPTCISS